MKKKDIHDKIIEILKEAYVDDVPNVHPDKEIKTHMPYPFPINEEDCDSCEEVDKDLSEDYLQDDPEEIDYEEGELDGEVPEKGAENYKEIDESELFEQKKPEDTLPRTEPLPDVGAETPSPDKTANATGSEVDPTKVDPMADPTAGGMTDPSMGANIPGMDPITGGMGGEPQTSKDIGRVFELKKIYTRLISIEQYLSFTSDEFLIKLKVYISKAVQLFETLIFNIQIFKDRIDDIIVIYYKFIDTVYMLLKKHYEKKDKENRSEDK